MSTTTIHVPALTRTATSRAMAAASLKSKLPIFSQPAPATRKTLRPGRGDEDEDEEDKEEQDEQMELVEATAELQDRVDLTVKQIKSIVPKAKGSKKKDVQRSAMEVATYAQIKKLHKRLGFRDNANTQAVRANISHLWFAAQ